MRKRCNVGCTWWKAATPRNMQYSSVSSPTDCNCSFHEDRERGGGREEREREGRREGGREREREGGREREGERERERGKCKPEFLLLTFPSGSSGESKVLRKSAKACSSVHFPLATFGCFLTLYTLQQKQSTHTHFEHSLILDHIHYAFIIVTPQKNYSTKCRIVGLVKVF